MGVSEKPQVNKEVKRGELEAPNQHKKWKIQIRSSLKPIRITNTRFPSAGESGDDDEEDECCSTTPTSEESRIPAKACPPPPPRKRKTASGRGCSYGGGGGGNSATAKEFFCPPDLDTVFIRRHVA